ncbi:MAG: AAA family ATPase [Thermodesulfobacteriota bacterium]|nr:AAA family ATPase [Thermodesulfobacteriota bacterium]
MSQVIDKIVEWAKSKLKYWEQYLLERILSGQEVGDTEIQQAKNYFLEDIINHAKAAQRPTISFPKTAPQAKGWKTRLTELKNNKDANQLKDDQRLEFAKQLTVIYGDNASGKSGYARLMACAGMTLGDRHVLPDVTKVGCSTCTPKAEFVIKRDGEDETTVLYSCGDPCPDLSFIHVFDATSVLNHLSENPFSFTPAGLECLSQLSEATDAVRIELRKLTENLTKPHDLLKLFDGDETEVTALIKALDKETDLEKLERLSTVSDGEQAGVEELETKIVELTKLDKTKEIAKLERLKASFQELKKSLETAAESLSNDKARKVAVAVGDLVSARKTAEATGADQFRSEHFKAVGSKAWQRFLAAAKDLAREEEIGREPYPQPEDRCLLCGQPLEDGDVRKRFEDLWKYVEGEAQDALKKAKEVTAGIKSDLQSINLGFYTEQTITFQYLAEKDKELHKQIETFAADCVTRKKNLLARVDGSKVSDQEPLPANPALKVQGIMDALTETLKDLRAKDHTKELAELKSQLLSLRHRIKLSNVKNQAKIHVLNLNLAASIDDNIGNTRGISDKRKALFQELAGEGYLAAFNHFLRTFSQDINIKAEISAPKKGPLRELQLVTGEAETLKDASVPKVLSEGEKRAVALADFLAEISIDPDCTCIVFDDPVTSLDNQWKETAAATLVQESGQRQVVVFTHDLPFLCHLKSSSEENGIEIEYHWVTREGKPHVPGHVFLKNCPALDSEYKTSGKVRDIIKQAKEKPPEIREQLLKQGFGALRTSYEALIIYDIFGGVVKRFDARIRPDYLKNVVANTDILTMIQDKYAQLSRFIEGHLPVDGLVERPSLEILVSEADKFDSLRGEIKKLRKK